MANTTNFGVYKDANHNDVSDSNFAAPVTFGLPLPSVVH